MQRPPATDLKKGNFYTMYNRFAILGNPALAGLRDAEYSVLSAPECSAKEMPPCQTRLQRMNYLNLLDN